MPLKPLVLLALFSGFSLIAKSQLVVQNELTPSQLINDVLLGEGIDAQNITFNGTAIDNISSQFGTFNAQNSNIGLSHGIILATGGVTIAESPNDLPTAYVVVPESEEYNIEPDLAQIMAPAALNDVAVIEFDFTAQGDTLRFKYVFASEEYNEHTCSPYNDAFGFFISGPGIPENPNYEHNAQNVALVPGKDVPVAINTVNQGYAGEFGANSVCNAESTNWQENSVFFVNNESNNDLNATQFDGFTVPLMIEIPVVCGGTYHIKMAIADATDGKNDSAVFIEAGSFSSLAPLEANLSVLQPDTAGNAVEGCSSYKLRLSRSDSTGTKTVYLRTSGIENPDEIFTNLPDSVTFYALDGVKTIELNVANNGNFEGLRDFNLEILQPQVCSVDTAIISMASSLIDFAQMHLSYPDSIALSCDETAVVNIQPDGGYEPYTISWDQPNVQGFQFNSAPDSLKIFTGTVTDFCQVNSENIHVVVYRQIYDSVAIQAPSQVSYNCAEPVSITPVVTGGVGQYTYSWSQNEVVLSNQLQLNQILTSSSPLIFHVNDHCMPGNSTEIMVVSQVNQLHVSLGPDTSGSCVNPIVVVPEVYGGFGNLSYVWSVNNLPASSSPTFSAQFSQSSGVTLTVTDACGQTANDAITIYITHTPLNIELPTDTVICENERLILDPKVSGGFGNYTYFWNNIEIPSGIYSVIPKRNIIYNFSVKDECGAHSEGEVKVDIQKVIAEFEFDYEHQNVPIINHSSPDCWYSWNFHDGTTSNDFEPVIDPSVAISGNTFLTVRSPIGCEAEAMEYFNAPFRLFIPTAFTPDGDGLNDIFKAKGMFVASFKMMIFDRWGKMIFQSDDINKGWDGSVEDTGAAAIDDVYSYRYIAKDLAGIVHEDIGAIRMMR